MHKTGIVAFAFGTPSQIKPNQLIALIASRKAKELKAPIYTQLGVPIQQGITVEYATANLGDPPSTFRLARGAVRWAEQQGIGKLWVCAAQPHLQRCLRDLRYISKKARKQIKILACPEIARYPKEEWYCRDSGQVRTRSGKKWWRREIILRITPMRLYKLFAG